MNFLISYLCDVKHLLWWLFSRTYYNNSQLPKCLQVCPCSTCKHSTYHQWYTHPVCETLGFGSLFTCEDFTCSEKYMSNQRSHNSRALTQIQVSWTGLQEMFHELNQICTFPWSSSTSTSLCHHAQPSWFGWKQDTTSIAPCLHHSNPAQHRWLAWQSAHQTLITYLAVRYNASFPHAGIACICSVTRVYVICNRDCVSCLQANLLVSSVEAITFHWCNDNLSLAAGSC